MKFCLNNCLTRNSFMHDMNHDTPMKIKLYKFVTSIKRCNENKALQSILQENFDASYVL